MSEQEKARLIELSKKIMSRKSTQDEESEFDALKDRLGLSTEQVIELVGS